MYQHNLSITTAAPLGAVSFGALIPARGFRWVYRDEEDEWHLREPPADWPDVDYQAEAFDNEDLHPTPKPTLSDRFYLAASTDDCLLTHEADKTDFGALVSAPDLFLRFASEQPTPALMLELANRYGLLRYSKSHFGVRKEKAAEILEAIECKDPRVKPHPEILNLTAEKASRWIQAFATSRHMIQSWADLQSEGTQVLEGFLNDGFNYSMGGSLTYQVHLDPKTGQAHNSVIASSLADAIEVQWGMSIASNALHRQCSECPTWFAVHPGSGRPEKKFCSDACRMRAYRKRKAANESET